MRSCEHYQEDLSALVDGELGSEAAGDLRHHLEVCADCRQVHEDIQTTRDTLGRTFAVAMASAPAAPPALSTRAPAARRGRLLRLRWIAVAGVAAAVLVFALFNLFEVEEAAAADVLKMAADRHLDLEEYEFFATIDSEFFQVLGNIFDVKPKTSAGSTCLRILARAPDWFVIHEVENLNTRKVKAGEVVGFQGETAWKYDPEKGEVTFCKSGDMTFGFLGGKTRIKKGHSNLFKLLSWDFYRSMADDQEHQQITEITGPFDRRIRRRVFRLQPKPKADGKKQWIWSKTDVTINPAENLVERMEFDINLTGISIFGVKIELAEANPGLSDAVFDHRTYTPPGTPVVGEVKGE